jgi:desampylase
MESGPSLRDTARRAVTPPRPERDRHVLALTRDDIALITAHATAAAPDECCGILLGKREGDEITVRQVAAVPNVFEGDRRSRYELDARTHLRVQREARAAGLGVLGFYHSHPAGPAVPSQADVERAWLGYAYLIVTLGDAEPPARCWRLDRKAGRFIEVPMRILPAGRL